MVPNSANSSNAVVQDVHLLFATDDQLRDDLAYVCSLLDSPERKPSPPSSSITRTSKSPEESKPTLSHQDRRKREILELRRQVDILKNQLLDAKQQATGKPDMSAWERAARDQMYAKSKSISENEQLRAQLDVHSEEWKAYKLAAQTSLRTAAIHAIADRQYQQLQTAFIQAGVYDCPQDVIRYEPVPLPDGSLIFERVYHVTLAAPFRLIGKAVWKVFNGHQPMPLPSGAEEFLERIDPHTVYRAYQNVGKTSSAHANMIYKNYAEANREVIVWRSVMDDALMPHMVDGEVVDTWGWFVVVPTADPAVCRATYLLQVVPIPLYKDRQATYAEYLHANKLVAEKYAFKHPPDVPGTFPGGAVNDKVDYPIFVCQAMLHRARQTTGIESQEHDQQHRF
ncbi:hypothetical protein AeMF1_018898 [Aphanomyces euteiches]|nr:hypothetical protein AeMF1_018898 [Aphanomyces euteiches]KAH9187398.1 hypothetical protein AeNC1_010619 [Aphanomyces euteiches]